MAKMEVDLPHPPAGNRHTDRPAPIRPFTRRTGSCRLSRVQSGCTRLEAASPFLRRCSFPVACRLPAPVIAQQPHRIRPALPAMAHLRHIDGAGITHLRQLGGLWRSDPFLMEPASRRQNQRHNIMGKRPQPFRRFRHKWEMAVIDARDKHRIDFAQNTFIRKPADPLQLPVKQQGRRLQTAVYLAAVPDMGIYPAAGPGIHRIHRHRHMADS
ncbi:hypothetical protein D3C75_765910 [compost metagenome]